MKKILLTMICLFLLAHVQAQSLSAKQLINLSDEYSQSDFLKSRSFTSLGSHVSENGISENFAKNIGAGNQESIFITGNAISYLTRSKAFITVLLSQLQHRFKQTASDDDSKFSYYQFAGGGGKNISVNISKSSNNYHSLVIMQK